MTSRVLVLQTPELIKLRKIKTALRVILINEPEIAIPLIIKVARIFLAARKERIVPILS